MNDSEESIKAPCRICSSIQVSGVHVTISRLINPHVAGSIKNVPACAIKSSAPCQEGFIFGKIKSMIMDAVGFLSVRSSEFSEIRMSALGNF